MHIFNDISCRNQSGNEVYNVNRNPPNFFLIYFLSRNDNIFSSRESSDFYRYFPFAWPQPKFQLVNGFYFYTKERCRFQGKISIFQNTTVKMKSAVK